MKRFTGVLALLLVVITGCRTIESPIPQVVTSQTESAESLPRLEVDSLDPSIPLGDSFPIVVKLKNAPPNQTVAFRLESSEIVPSQSEMTTTTDGSGAATMQVSGRSTKPVLNTLYAYADFPEGDSLTSELYVNFEPPQPSELNLQTQATGPIMGEPTTFGDYIDSFPQVTSLDDLKDYDEIPGSGVVIKGVRFPGEKLPNSKLEDIVSFNVGSWTSTPTSETPTLQAQQNCAVTNTTIRFTSWIDTAQRPLPPGTKVYITANGNTPGQTRYLGSNGNLTFQVGCSADINLRLEAWTPTGMYIHSPRPYLVAWEYHLSGNPPLNAASLRGKSYSLADKNTESSRRNALRVWYKINQVYDWERSAHNLYDTFPLSTVYPDGNPVINNSRAHFGRMYIEPGHATFDKVLFHEFGHEVYYRRMLGGGNYNRFHQDAVRTNNTSFPACAGYLFVSDYWDKAEGCVAMLEGFAEWFSIVSESSIKNEPSINAEYTRKNNLGWSVPGRVWSFLYDITDLAGASAVRDGDNDEVRVWGTPKERYARTAAYFQNQTNTAIGFPDAYKTLIKPRLPVEQRGDYCKVLNRNTIECF